MAENAKEVKEEGSRSEGEDCRNKEIFQVARGQGKDEKVGGGGRRMRTRGKLGPGLSVTRPFKDAREDKHGVEITAFDTQS